MKNTFLFGLGVLCCMLLSFKIDATKDDVKQENAVVSQIEGVYIFTDCKPLSQYDELGVVELYFSGDTQYQSIRDNLIKKAKKKYPEADGLIFDFNKRGVDKCLAIDFK